MGAKDVDLDKPPTSSQFASEDYQIQTLAEKASIIARRARLPSTNNQMYTPSRVSSSGRIMPPRLIPDLDEDENIESSLITSPRPGSDMEDSAPDVGGAPGSPKGVDHDADELSTTGSDSPAPHPKQQKRSLVSSASSDVELVSAPVSIHRSPARKLPRSPSYGDGVAHTLSRLTFNRNRSPKRDSYSPPRKVAGSRGSSNVISATNSTSDRGHIIPTPALKMYLPPLNDAGRHLSMDDFLDHCNFAPSDMITRGLIDLAHIRHWSYFREASLTELQRLNFPLPIARQLTRGAMDLEKTHAGVDE